MLGRGQSKSRKSLVEVMNRIGRINEVYISTLTVALLEMKILEFETQSASACPVLMPWHNCGRKSNNCCVFWEPCTEV